MLQAVSTHLKRRFCETGAQFVTWFGCRSSSTSFIHYSHSDYCLAVLVYNLYWDAVLAKCTRASVSRLYYCQTTAFPNPAKSLLFVFFTRDWRRNVTPSLMTRLFARLAGFARRLPCCNQTCKCVTIVAHRICSDGHMRLAVLMTIISIYLSKYWFDVRYPALV